MYVVYKHLKLKPYIQTVCEIHISLFNTIIHLRICVNVSVMLVGSNSTSFIGLDGGIYTDSV